jgi:prepilin-type N-terminal cleavage/methylation domain-containing protein
MPTSVRSSATPGLTLIEVMIALSILLVGLLGMMHMQIIGITSNNGGRMATVGTEVAQELVQGLERLPFGDPLLESTGTSGPSAPDPFGRLVVGSAVATGAHEWSDSTPVPGVRASTEISPQFERRWTVWGFSPSAGALPAVKIIAVSVVYREPGLAIPREVVQYTQIFDSGALVAAIPANM